MTRVIRVVVASALCMLAAAGCAEVAGVTSHELGPGTDAGPDAESSDGGADTGEPDVNPNPWAAVPEQCNFADDDHNGECDEGFLWKSGTWHPVYSGAKIASVEAVRLTDGKVAAMVLEAEEPELSSRVLLLRTGQDGAALGEPVEVWSSTGTLGVGITATATGEVGVGLKPAGAGCDGGSCPIEVRRFVGSDLSFAGTTTLERAAIQPEVVPTQRLLDLAWTGAGFVALAVDGDGYARLVWENESRDIFKGNWNGLIDETKPYAASLAVGPLLGYGVCRNGLSGQQEVVGGMSSLGAYKQLLRPSVVSAGGGGNTMLAPRGKKMAVWSGSDLIVMAVMEGPVQERTTRLGRIRFDGQIGALTPVLAEGYLLAGADERLMVASASAGGFEVLRMGTALAQIGGAIPVSDASELAIVATGGVPVLLRVSADRTQVLAAALECE